MAGTVCQHCGENPATIHFTEIKDDERVELHVCEECAAAQGITHEASLPGQLASMVMAAGRSATATSLQCKHCGMTWKEFRRRGRLGCSHDYEVFESVLVPLIANMHGGADRHVGRLPHGHTDASANRGEQLMDLRRQLTESVEAERYEQAARLRDDIQALEQATGATPGPAPNPEGAGGDGG